MKLTTLKERIAKAEEKVAKKENTIAKKTARIEKLSAGLTKKFGIDPETFDRYAWRELNGTEEENYAAYWTMCDIHGLHDDIKRNHKEIKATLETIEKYKKQLAGEIARESILIKEIPGSMKLMQTQLVEKWDEWDKERRAKLRADHKELGYREFFKHHTAADYDFMYITDEQIHEGNLNDAKELIIDLFYRVKEITGEITSWAGVHATHGTCGMTVLNGYVEGKEGRAEVESILAGGYNIQRLHVRVLVKSIG